MSSRAATDRPNIILINCDDLGYGDLGCYGSTVHDTPALDQMAAEGMRFTDFYMASPVCSPSRGAMMTGCYPPRISFDTFVNGAWVLHPGNGMGLHPDEITVATLLKEQGYATKLVGKWHCGDQPDFLPTRHGFDSYFGIPFSNDMGRQAFRDMKSQPPPLPLLRDETVCQQQPDQAALTERYVDECLQFIRAKQEEPFFLYFAHMYVHLPLYAPQHFLDQSRNGSYGAAVACVDWSVKTLLHELKQLGLDEQTLVIFTSDNGGRAKEGGSNAPLRGAKGSTWEGGQRVPCIARWPGVVPAGTTCQALTSAIDFMPTFAKLAGTEAPTDRQIDGADIGPLLRGEQDAEAPHDLFFYYLRHDLQAVRDDHWKLHVAKGRGEPTLELYDLQQDIGETQNVADAHPEIVERLQQALAACAEDMGDTVTGKPGKNRRPIGTVDNPKPLTEYDPDHPYIIAMYDKHEHG